MILTPDQGLPFKKSLIMVQKRDTFGSSRLKHGARTLRRFYMLPGLIRYCFYRQTIAPDVATTQYPAFKALKSTDNIAIEGRWHWLREQIGHNLYHHITRGRDEGYFNPNNEVHM